MKRVTLLAVLAALMVTFVPVSGIAQVAKKASPQMKRNDRDNHEELAKKAMSELVPAVTEFWNPKLNEYKVRIDRALSSSDLETLNKLRVRWAILTGDLMQKFKTLMSEGEKGKANVDAGKDDPNVAMDASKGMELFQEIAMIYQSAKDIAGRNRTNLDGVKESVVGDVASFADAMEVRANKFIDNNRTMFNDEKDITKARKEIGKGLTDLKSEKGRQGIRQVYVEALEPIVLLYNGADLNQLLPILAQGTSVTKQVATTGITLPESAVLKQNVPNPASSSTKIVYNLPEASTRTMLRIYSTNGTEVASYDEGAQSAGSHERTVDVSGLSSGSYLYHLTIQTSRGEQVFSKTMSIVR